MNVIPLYDRILVRIAEAASDRRKPNGLMDGSEGRALRGTVIAAGAGAVNEEGQTVPMTVHSGDIILFDRHHAQEVTFGGTAYWIMKAADIISVELKAPVAVLREWPTSPRSTRSS